MGAARLSLIHGLLRGTTTDYPFEQMPSSRTSRGRRVWVEDEGVVSMAHFTMNPATGFPTRAGLMAFWRVKQREGNPGGPRMFGGITNDRHASESRALQGVSMIFFWIFRRWRGQAHLSPGGHLSVFLISSPSPNLRAWGWVVFAGQGSRVATTFGREDSKKEFQTQY